MNSLSIVTCSMNRTEHLLQCAQAASKCNVHSEHIIIDWSSRKPVQIEQLPDDNRIKLLRVDGEVGWTLTRAYNFAWSFCTGSHVLKLDADQLVSGAFWDQNFWGQDAFIANDLALGDSFEKSTTGTFFAPLERLLQVGGFNEYLTGWGFDDIDLFARLRGVCIQRFLDVSALSSIDHDDYDRVKDSLDKNTKSLPADILKSCSNARNKWLAQTLIWNASIKSSSYYEVDGCWRADYVPSLPEYFTEEEAFMAQKLALEEVLRVRIEPVDHRKIVEQHNLVMHPRWIRCFRAISWVPRLYSRVVNFLLQAVFSNKFIRKSR